MPPATESAAFDRGVKPLLDLILVEKAEEIAAFRAPSELRERIEGLAEKCSDGTLTEAERAEYAGYVRANKFVAILQKRARQAKQR